MKLHELYRLTENDINKGSEVLRDAFMNYPTFMHFFPEPGEREEKLKYLTAFFIRCGLLRGDVYAPSENIEGVAIWYRSVSPELSTLDIFSAGLFRLVLRFGLRSFIQLIKLGNVKKSKRKELMNGEYLFLDMIGIDPAFERQGYGRMLIESKLEHEKEHLPTCFLETSNTENIDYYKRFGFDVAGDYTHKGLHSFCMVKG